MNKDNCALKLVDEIIVVCDCTYRYLRSCQHNGDVPLEILYAYITSLVIRRSVVFVFNLLAPEFGI